MAALLRFIKKVILMKNLSVQSLSWSNSLQPHESQHARPPCPSPIPRVHSNSCSSSRWCHPAISPSVIPFSSCPQSLPASESFPMSQLFTWRGQSTGVSALASFLPKNTQDWSPLEWTGWISLQFKGLSMGRCKNEHGSKIIAKCIFFIHFIQMCIYYNYAIAKLSFLI